MSSSKLSFSIAVKLLTDNLKKGSASVKSYLRSMQMQFMSFAAAVGGGAIGLSNFVSKMIETAKETSRVNIALKNVSKSTGEYADHQKFIIGLSKKYGVQVNSLTSGFAKFKAAADISNMALSDQYKIFEAVSRAAVAFGLSAEDQRGVFLALSQMMSKGKIQAEELRLQMAERLPVAIQAMAKAAGVSVEEMDKLMKKGKLYSSDVLPRFAEALDEMIPNIDTDNLMTSLNRLSNAVVDIVKNWGIEERFKSIVDVVSRLLGGLANNAKTVFTGLKVLLTAGLGNAVYRVGKSIVDNYDKFVSASVKAQETLKTRHEATIRAQEALDRASADLSIAREAEKVAAVEGSETRKRRARNVTANAEKALGAKTTALVKAQEAEKAAAAKVTAETQKAAAASAATGWTKMCNVVSFSFARLGAAMKAAFSATIWTAAITAVMELVRWLVKAVTETNRIKNIVSDMERKLAEKVDNTQIQNLVEYQRILNDPSQGDTKRLGALKEINAILGENYDIAKLDSKLQDEINKKIEARKRLLAAQDRYNNAQAAANDSREQLRKLEDSEAYKEAFKRAYEDTYRDGMTAHQYVVNAEMGRAKKEPYANLYRRRALDELNADPLREAENLRTAIAKADKVISALAEEIAELGGSKASTAPPLFGDESGKKGKKTELEKQQEKYTESLRALQKKLDANIITQDEYDEALRDLIEKSYIDAYSSGDKGVLESEYYKALENSFKKLPRGEAYKAERQRIDILKEYSDSVKRRQAELEAGAITEKEYREALFDLTREARKNLASNMAGADDFEQAYFRGLGDLTRGLAPKPELKARDASRDYKKTDIDILEESLSVAEQNRDIFRRLAEETGGMFSEELSAAMSNVKTLEEALKIAEAKKAVEELTKELRTGAYNGVKSIVGSVDNIASAFERVGDVLSDGDASAWERIMAVWEAMTSISDAFIQTIEIIERLTKVKEMLAKAELAEAAVSDTVTEKKVANAAIGMAADAAETESTVVNAGTKVAAKTAEGAASAGASAASLPFPWNIVAIGSAIAAALAAFAMIPRFENGGIVGGNSSKGDKILARLNSGELVLTKDQQGTLYGLLNNRGRSVEVSGEFKVRGRDLVAAIDNNNKFKKRVK